jgi:hypothetical protein
MWKVLLICLLIVWISIIFEIKMSNTYYKNNRSMNKTATVLLVMLGLTGLPALAQGRLALSNEQMRIAWAHTGGEWVIQSFEGKTAKGHKPFGTPVGQYGLIYSETKPATAPVPIVAHGDTIDFPENTFRLVKPGFQRATAAVPMNKAGDYFKFYPTEGYRSGEAVVFEQETPYGVYKAVWSMDKNYPSDILLSLSLTAAKPGYYSLPTPTIGTLAEDKLQWAVVPGFFQGNSIQPSFPLAYAYAQGLPEYPVLCRENTITTMASIMSENNGLTLAIIPEPGQDRNPYAKDESTHAKHWNIALSHMNRDAQLIPTAYHPVLGENNSFLKEGETMAFHVRITLQAAGWYAVYKHAIYDIYKLSSSFELKTNKHALTDRLFKLYDYVLDDNVALWRKEEYGGREITGQSYLGDVAGADNDAMKNADIGAVWMLARLSQDKQFNENRIPYIRNFKILQQSQKGFFKGAVEGQYYLATRKRFTEEWGNHFEPVAITYYTMSDLGNILLFEPDNNEIKELLNNGAERLLEWQQDDGSWVVAYDRDTHKPLYTDLKDYRPTFYGLIIAYKIFGDEKYLKAAQKGADWIIKNAVNNGHFLGVCGDVRFVNDFATGQISAAMLDLYEITGKQKYLDAAIETARIYTTSIYTHPIPDREIKILNGAPVEDWQLSQVGLNFEHGGSMGSAVNAGPVLLTSHCAHFLKLYTLTGDELFRDMARLGALGKDAFVNEKTGVASYYWHSFDAGAGPFPHHAWWQIGWIYDYLLAEAELRSNGKILFPRGFMTSKVGPHKTAGFDSGTIEGQPASLILRKNLVEINNPNIDYITAQGADSNTLFVIFLNNQGLPNHFNYKINLSNLWSGADIEEGTYNIDSFGYSILKIKI